MGFLKTTQTIRTIQDAQRSGRPKQTYTISIQDVVEDYNTLLKMYYNASSLSSQEFKLLQEECSAFYNLVEKQARSFNSLPQKEQSKLYEIFISVKKIKKSLSQRTVQDESGNN